MRAGKPRYAGARRSSSNWESTRRRQPRARIRAVDDSAPGRGRKPRVHQRPRYRHYRVQGFPKRQCQHVGYFARGDSGSGRQGVHVCDADRSRTSTRGWLTPSSCAKTSGTSILITPGRWTPIRRLRWRSSRRQLACSSDTRVSNSEGATVSTNRGTRAYGNTHGFVGSYSKTSHSVSCVLACGSRRCYAARLSLHSGTHAAEDLEACGEVGRRRRENVSRLGARKIKTTRAPVLYIPEVARGFIGHAIGAISGGAQYRRSSFLLDAVGEDLFPDFVSILERPHLPGAMASAPYDGEGVATYDRDIVA